MAVGLSGDSEKYIAELKKRSKESHVHRQFQLTGLEIADLLGDRAHKSLYIKLAKERSAHELLRIAKEVAGKQDVRRKGAYFMAIVTGTAKPAGQKEIFRSKPARSLLRTKRNGGKSRKNPS